MLRSLTDRWNGAPAPAAPPQAGATLTPTFVYLEEEKGAVQGRIAGLCSPVEQVSSVWSDGGNHGASPLPSLTSTSGNVLCCFLKMSHLETFLSAEMILRCLCLTFVTWKVLKGIRRGENCTFPLLSCSSNISFHTLLDFMLSFSISVGMTGILGPS